MCKTLALRGAKKVAVKENLAASRERVSIMTTCDSGAGDGESCSIGILFRTQGSSGERIAASLRKRREALLQFAPKGSYRFEHVMEFLEWAVRPQDKAETACIVVLDWFAPHLDERIDDF